MAPSLSLTLITALAISVSGLPISPRIHTAARVAHYEDVTHVFTSAYQRTDGCPNKISIKSIAEDKERNIGKVLLKDITIDGQRCSGKGTVEMSLVSEATSKAGNLLERLGFPKAQAALKKSSPATAVVNNARQDSSILVGFNEGSTTCGTYSQTHEAFWFFIKEAADFRILLRKTTEEHVSLKIPRNVRALFIADGFGKLCLLYDKKSSSGKTIGIRSFNPKSPPVETTPEPSPEPIAPVDHSPVHRPSPVKPIHDVPEPHPVDKHLDHPKPHSGKKHFVHPKPHSDKKHFVHPKHHSGTDDDTDDDDYKNNTDTDDSKDDDTEGDTDGDDVKHHGGHKSEHSIVKDHGVDFHQVKKHNSRKFGKAKGAFEHHKSDDTDDDSHEDTDDDKTNDTDDDETNDTDDDKTDHTKHAVKKPHNLKSEHGFKKFGKAKGSTKHDDSTDDDDDKTDDTSDDDKHDSTDDDKRHNSKHHSPVHEHKPGHVIEKEYVDHAVHTAAEGTVHVKKHESVHKLENVEEGHEHADNTDDDEDDTDNTGDDKHDSTDDDKHDGTDDDEKHDADDDKHVGTDVGKHHDVKHEDAGHGSKSGHTVVKEYVEHVVRSGSHEPIHGKSMVVEKSVE